jgi:TolB protein
VLTVSASDTGVLAFPSSRSGSFGHLTWFSRDGKAQGSIEPPSDQAEYLNPTISPDGRLVAANLIDPGTGVWHIWLIDGARGNSASRLTTDAASDFDPVWSSDGSEIAYTSDRDGRVAFYRQAISGGAAAMLRDASHELSPIASDWSRNGHLLFQLLQRSIWDYRLADHATTRLGPENTLLYGAHFSPDGKWVAYAQASPNQFDIFVERFPGGSPRKQISTSTGGVHPRWTTTSRGLELVYWAPPGGILSTALSLGDQGIRVGDTRTLVDLPVLTLADVRPHYDVTRDGQRLLVRQPARPQGPGIRVIVNWTARLPH